MCMAPAELMEALAPRVDRPRRKVPTAAHKIARSVGVWLDRWALRSCEQDTHSWAAKMETIHRLHRGRP